jgi:small subunit ribosomal protein S5
MAKKPFPERKPFSGGFKRPFSGGERMKNPRRNNAQRSERVKPEFDQKILNIRRVTRVTKGGKRMNFSICMVVGNKKGSVGVGTGKANDTSAAIDKAYKNAKKNVIQLNLTKQMSIPHDVSAKYCSGRISIMPAPGKGVSAGSALKSVLELAGIKDVTGKIISPSKNKLNISRATISALSAFDKKKFANVQKTETKIADDKIEK